MRVYLPPGSGFDHHCTQTGLPLSLRRSSNTTPLVSVPRPTDANASWTRRWASGVSGTSDIPTMPGTSSGLIPRIRRAARLALMNRDSRSSLT